MLPRHWNRSPATRAPGVACTRTRPVASTAGRDAAPAWSVTKTLKRLPSATQSCAEEGRGTKTARATLVATPPKATLTLL